MSADYAAVIADLTAKRDGLTDLIAALQNLSRLLPGQPLAQLVEAPSAEKVVGRSVGTRRVPPRAKPEPNRRATDAPSDEAVVARVNKATGGIRFADLVSAFPSNATAREMKAGMLRLVEEGRITRHGAGRGSRYWPAGTTAKEAL